MCVCVCVCVCRRVSAVVKAAAFVAGESVVAQLAIRRTRLAASDESCPPEQSVCIVSRYHSHVQ